MKTYYITIYKKNVKEPKVKKYLQAYSTKELFKIMQKLIEKKAKFTVDEATCVLDLS